MTEVIDINTRKIFAENLKPSEDDQPEGRPPAKTLINSLTKCIERAEAGELVGIVGTLLWADGQVGPAIYGDSETLSDMSIISIAGLELTKSSMTQVIEGTAYLGNSNEEPDNDEE